MSHFTKGNRQEMWPFFKESKAHYQKQEILKKAFSQNERQQDVLATTEEENYNGTNSRLTGLQQREPVKRAAAVPWEILFFKTKADLSTHYGPLLHYTEWLKNATHTSNLFSLAAWTNCKNRPATHTKTWCISNIHFNVKIRSSNLSRKIDALR